MLQALVRTPSVSGEEAAAVQEVFDNLGLTVECCRATAEQLASYREHLGDGQRLEKRPSVVGLRQSGGTGRSILLNAPVDTVDAGDPAA